MNFSRFLDIQSWWEVPSIAYFCSLFRTAFNLLDFDIEELEEALLTDGTEESASSLLTELIVRLLNGCLGNNDISAFNYQMYLRRLFRRKCQATGRYNPFNTDIDFQFLPLRTKVEILYALCDFRLDSGDVFDLFKNLEAESLRVEPLGWDDNDSAYWYFYGTRLYREDIIKKTKGKSKKKKSKESKKRGWFYGDDWLDDDESERVWQVVCFTEEDWIHLTDKFSKATSKVEKELYRSLSQNFLPEIPRLFQEKERLQRKRLLELAPRRTSNRVLQKIKQKEEDIKHSNESKDDEESKQTAEAARENRAKRRNLLRSKSVSSATSDSSSSDIDIMPQKKYKRSKSQDKKSKNSSSTQKGEPPPNVPLKSGRKTNNSLASATGQIVIPDNEEPTSSTRKKLKTSQIFSQTEEDIQTDMYKVLEQLTTHDDAWPFMDPVDEEYAPNYYAVIRRPMDLHKMEKRLDTGYYSDFSMFKADFKLIVNNCRLYNGQDNEYTLMVDNLQAAFDRLTEKYMHRLSSSDEEIAVEYQLPTPSRKHKIKAVESPTDNKRKKLNSLSDSGEASCDSPELQEIYVEDKQKVSSEKDSKNYKESKSKGKKKRKGHHRHGKHSKNHKKDTQRSDHSEIFKTKHNKKQKHSKEKDKDTKKAKQKKKPNKHHEQEFVELIKRSTSQDSLESSRSASPLPSIHTPSPSPTELNQSESGNQFPDTDFYKDKYDKIKERIRHAPKDAWESLFDHKQKSTVDKQKQNLNIPEKEKNQNLRETIEKLKAKNEKYTSDTSLFNSLFSAGQSSANKNTDSNNHKESIEKSQGYEESDEEDSNQIKGKSTSKKTNKKNFARNESASEALEQAVKDISKWLDDAPKTSAASSPCDSPAQTISTEDYDHSRLDDEFSQGDKQLHPRKDSTRKRPSSRDAKVVKRREVQRTIERLQPGKSKGNLLTNIATKNCEKVEEFTPVGPVNKVRDVNKGESSPKLNLGSVLPTVEFTLGNDHNFGNTEDKKKEDMTEIKNIPEIQEVQSSKKSLIPSQEVRKKEDQVEEITEKDAEVETEAQNSNKLSQEKATPNLSAWFKAFGAPKSVPTPATKKKVEESDVDKPSETSSNCDCKSISPKTTNKFEPLIDPETPNPEGGDSPLPNTTATPRQRRTSTGSSVSERSSFSQDLDSPRHHMSHTSPLLSSPASPRTDDFQKITYPIINGTVRAGFYQDTTSIKSSPEKSCSPREALQSPYSPYSQHVYASNSVVGSTTPNYFGDQNKSPLPTNGHNPPPYYDTTKVPPINKHSRSHDDYTSLGPDSYQHNQYTGPFSPAPYDHNQPSNYSQQSLSQSFPLTNSNNTPVHLSQVSSDTKNTLFPVKKRVYNEPDNSSTAARKTIDQRDSIDMKNQTGYQKSIQCLNNMSTLPLGIANTVEENSENSKDTVHNVERRSNVESRENITLNNNDFDKKKEATSRDKLIGIATKDKIDMINMGYMNTENERRSSSDAHNDFVLTKEILKSNINSTQKGFEVESIAINLGLNNPHVQKTLIKPTLNTNTIPPAHSHDRSHNDISLNQNVSHSIHNQYDGISGGQAISNFSLNDIELANKKLYACNSTPTSSTLDCSNWKIGNQIRQQDLPSDYSTTFNAAVDKIKSDASIPNSVNYNKNLQQYHNYNVFRTNSHRSQELQQNLPSELRIPNPRSLIKSDHNVISSTTVSNNEMARKELDTLNKTQKAEKVPHNHPLVNTMQYKTPYNTHPSLPLDGLRNLPNIPQMLERYTNNESYLSTFGANSSVYNDKTFKMAQMFNKPSSEIHPTTSTTPSIYSQSSLGITKENNIHKSSQSIQSSQTDAKGKNKKKRSLENKQTQIVGTSSYHTSSCNSDAVSSAKPSIVPGSAFNFGTPNMALGSGLYGDSSGFSIEDFRNSTASQLMAANYMAAVAHQQQQQRTNAESNNEKMVKPAHQNSSHTAGSFPFIGHSQVRSSYPFADASSPLYQQYLQRHREELFRQTGAQIIGLYSPGYPAALGVRQPYDSINRHTWL